MTRRGPINRSGLFGIGAPQRHPASGAPGLGETFNAPVVAAYGMTEAAHQTARNPPGSGVQRPGAAGIPAAPQMRIAHQTGNRLIDGTGEGVISGPNVTPGHEGNAKTSSTPRTRDGFCTGRGGSVANRSRVLLPHGPLSYVSCQFSWGLLKLTGMGADFYKSGASRHVMTGIRAGESRRRIPLDRVSRRKLCGFAGTAFS